MEATSAPAHTALSRKLAALAYCKYLRPAPGGHLFRGRLPARSPLVFAPLVGALASLPWVYAAPPSMLQAGVSLVLMALSASLVWMGWPRTRLLLVSKDLRTIHCGKTHVRLAGLPRIELSTSMPRAAPQCQYQVQLVDSRSTAGSTVRWPILKGPRPDRVAVDLHRWLGDGAQPEPGWGLSPAVMPWRFRAPERRSEDAAPGDPSGSSTTIAALRTDVRVANVMTAAAFVVTLIQLWLWLSSPSRSTTWLSVALPIGFSLYLVFVAGACRARTLYQRRGSRFRLRTGFPPRYGPWQSVAEIADVSVVGDCDGAGVCHVLVSMKRGVPVAGRVRSESAAEFKERVQQDAEQPAAECPLPSG